MAYVFMHDKALTTTQMSHNASVSLSHIQHITCFLPAVPKRPSALRGAVIGGEVDAYPHPPVDSL